MIRQRFWTLAALGLLAAWAVGQSFRDATWLTGLCFYFPSPVLALLMLGLAAASVAVKRRRLAAVAVLAALPPLGAVLFAENDFFARPPADGPAEVKLVHWNVGGRPERAGVAERLVAERADLYVLTEIVNDRHVALFLEELGDPGYQAVTFGELAVVGRGEVRVADGPVDRPGEQMRAVTWRHAGRTLELLVVDLPSSILVARDPLLREVNAVIADRRPDVVVGDFNAPRRSRALADLPAGYAHAYHTAGGGWGYTWPVPVPVLAIDQCLHGPRVVPVRYRLDGMGGGSDHRFQVFEFSLKTGG